MNNTSFDRIKDLEDMPMPKELHAKIMKRVFIASYGKYLYLATAILFVNLTVLSMDLYRRLVELDVAKTVDTLVSDFAFSVTYLQSALSTLYTGLPVQSILATGVTAALCAYMTHLFVKLHRNPQSIGMFRNMLS